MSDSPLEELEAHEHAEHAKEGHESGNPLIAQVTFTIAVLAVAAAVVASLETTEGDHAIVTKNEAVLEQNRATDQWNLYEAKSVKKNLYALAAEQGGPKAKDYAKTAAKNEGEQAGIMKEAKAFEAKRDAKSEEAEVHEARHGRLTIASTLLHMSIAIATLAIILGRRWPWLASIALAGSGVVLAVWAYFPLT
jgi:hypothetical protein